MNKEFSGYITETPNVPRETLVEIEHAIASQANARFGDACFPLEHFYADGMYIRKIFMPAGHILTSKIHKKDHPYFVLSGEVDVLTEEGTVRIKAPYWGITKAGTKRVILTIKSCVWITCHATEEKDLGRIEEEIIAKSFTDLEKEKLCHGQPQHPQLPE